MTTKDENEDRILLEQNHLPRRFARAEPDGPVGRAQAAFGAGETNGNPAMRGKKKAPKWLWMAMVAEGVGMTLVLMWLARDMGRAIPDAVKTSVGETPAKSIATQGVKAMQIHIQVMPPGTKPGKAQKFEVVPGGQIKGQGMVIIPPGGMNGDATDRAVAVP